LFAAIELSGGVLPHPVAAHMQNRKQLPKLGSEHEARLHTSHSSHARIMGRPHHARECWPKPG
jgi:hypothetical protein